MRPLFAPGGAPELVQAHRETIELAENRGELIAPGIFQSEFELTALQAFEAPAQPFQRQLLATRHPDQPQRQGNKQRQNTATSIHMVALAVWPMPLPSRPS